MSSVTEELEKLMHMLDRGLLTRGEFEVQKQQILARNASTIGSYQLTGDIGQGGMGRVYQGRHQSENFANQQGGDVAIKVLHPHYAEHPDMKKRFEREALLGIQLKHPGIVKVFELVINSGRVALVMEKVEGRPLSEMIGSETGPIPWTRAENLIKQLMDAIGYAHTHGVIHRDLKPENIMVGLEGDLKILDFGIAKEMHTGHTQTGTGIGTPDYMAPEQYLDAKNVDARADIYGLGMTLYEMLAGQLPWPDTTPKFTILDLKRMGQIAPPTEFYPHIPPAVVEIVMKMIRPTVSDRFQTIQSIALALSQLQQPKAGPSPTPKESETTPHLFRRLQALYSRSGSENIPVPIEPMPVTESWVRAQEARLDQELQWRQQRVRERQDQEAAQRRERRNSSSSGTGDGPAAPPIHPELFQRLQLLYGTAEQENILIPMCPTPVTQSWIETQEQALNEQIDEKRKAHREAAAQAKSESRTNRRKEARRRRKEEAQARRAQQVREKTHKEAMFRSSQADPASWGASVPQPETSPSRSAINPMLLLLSVGIGVLVFFALIAMFS